MAQEMVNGDKIVDFKSLDKDVQELIVEAVKARKNSYSPYSKFAVGAAIRSTTDQIFRGCNIENSSFPVTICAERTAIFNGISEGHRSFKACAVIAEQENEFTAPCGSCRQVLNEFALTNFPVYLARPSLDNVFCTSVYSLLPYRFRLK